MTSAKPKVSIVVPIYNVEKYLRECLDSLIKQTLEDIEIICVNDGSTDSSAEILEEYKNKDSRIKVINKPNSGYGASMNMGFEKAQGEYIGIVESDDFANSKMFEDLYDLGVKNNADVVKSDFYYYMTAKKQARKAGKITSHKNGKPFNIKDDCSILKIVPSIWSAIYKREFLQSNGIKFLETPGASYQDTSFSFKAFSCAERIVFTPKGYINYRQDNENSSVKQKDKVFIICEEFKEITNFLNSRKEIKQVVNDTKLQIQFKTYMWNVKRIDEQYRDEFIDRFQAEFKEYFENGEITKEFYKKFKPAVLKMLLNDKPAFRNYIDDLVAKQTEKEKRGKKFSIRINSSRISIVLFGKTIVEIG